MRSAVAPGLIRPRSGPLDDVGGHGRVRLDQLRRVRDIGALRGDLGDQRRRIELAKQIHVVAVGADHRADAVLGKTAERRGDAGAREHARAIQHGHAARGHQLADRRRC